MARKKYPEYGSLAAVAALIVAILPARAEQALTVRGGEQMVRSYTCGDGESRDITYVNAPPNSLVIVTIDGKKQIFANVLSASGARYASGVYIWWSKGSEASLYDLRHGPDAPPVAVCRETE